MDYLPARRKWIIRRDSDLAGGWVVTAPSGQRRWFFSWSSMATLCPFFVMGEASRGLRRECPLLDSGAIAGGQSRR